MDALLLLRVARVVLCACVIAVIVALAARRRIEWWKVIWLLLYLTNQMAFSAYILFGGLAGALDTPFARVWSILLDIHNSFATLAYLFVVMTLGPHKGQSKGRDAQHSRPDDQRRAVSADVRIDHRQPLLTDEAKRHAEWKREWEWLYRCRRREDQRGMAHVDAGAET